MRLFTPTTPFIFLMWLGNVLKVAEPHYPPFSSMTKAQTDPGHYHPSTDIFRQLQRTLQEGNNSSDQQLTTPNPDEVCSNLNIALKNQMNCTCARFDKTQVEISCVDLNELCNSDQSWCALSNVYWIIDRLAVPRVMLSCTNVTRLPSDSDRVDSCVQLFPTVDGNFSDIAQCNAMLNDGKCTCVTCSSQEEQEERTNRATNTTSITVNCCNVKQGALATCLPVGPNGRVLVQYDALPDGQCPASSAATKMMSLLLYSSWTTTMTMMSIGLVLLF